VTEPPTLDAQICPDGNTAQAIVSRRIRNVRLAALGTLIVAGYRLGSLWASL